MYIVSYGNVHLKRFLGKNEKTHDDREESK
jgi:hypothetical protein